MRRFSSYGPVDPARNFAVERRDLVHAVEAVADGIAVEAEHRARALPGLALLASSRSPSRRWRWRWASPEVSGEITLDGVKVTVVAIGWV